MPAYLIDASIIIFQAHFSPTVECKGSNGEDLSALYGFSQFLLQFLRRENPRLIAVAMDESLFCGFRHGLCPDYKSNRELPDDNLAMQLSACAELCRALGLACFGSRTYEADDIIGTLAKRLRDSRAEQSIAIITRDKDLSQLLRGKDDFLWDYQRNTRRGIPEIEAEFGVKPNQIPDYLGLIGDSVDRISGVPGLGPVKGRALLTEFGCLDGIYSSLERVANLPVRGARGLGELLALYRDLAYLSRTLATIVEDVDDEQEVFSVIPLEQLNRRPADTTHVGTLLRSCSFDQRFCNSMVNAVDRLNETLG